MYLALDFFHFANEADEKAFEESIAAFADYILFGGRVVQDPARRLTYCLVWKFESFEAAEANWRAYAETLDEDASNAMAWPGYRADHWWGCKVVDLEDPYLIEHGPEEWSKRDLQSQIDAAKTDPRISSWLNSIAEWALDNGDRPHRSAEYWLREQAGLPFKE